MNLGQLLGSQQLRIWELEEQLATGKVPARNLRLDPAVPPGHAISRAGGIVGQIRAVFAQAQAPLLIDQVKALLPHFPRPKIANNLQVMATTGKLKRIGSGRGARFWRVE